MQPAGLTDHVVCLSKPCLPPAYGDKNQRWGLTRALLEWNNVACQSTGYQGISKQDQPGKKVKKKTPKNKVFLQKQFHLDSNEEQLQDLNLALSSAESKNGNSQVFFVEDNHAALQQLGGEPP